MAAYTPVVPATELPAELPLMVSCRHAASYLNLSEKHLRNLCREKKIKALHAGRVWRIPRDVVLAMLNGEMEAANE